MSISKAVIMGTVVRNPEKRFTTNNFPITTFTINIGKEDGEPTLLRIVAKGRVAESTADAVKKGMVVIVDGKLQTNVAKTTSGAEKKGVEIDARSVEVVGQSTVTASQESSAEDLDYSEETTPDELIGEDEIPF
jgi:single-strand DNA-binding protein